MLETTEDEVAAEEQEEIILATVTGVSTANGIQIKADGDEEGGTKYYKGNAMQLFKTNDRVKIRKVAGTYLIDYVVGDPMARYPVPAGGSDGQVLTKDGSTAYAVKWTTPHGIPSGGTSGQVLAKSSDNNYAVGWVTLHGIPSGGSSGQYLKKSSGLNYEVTWGDAPNSLPTGGSAGQMLTKINATNYNVQWSDPPHGIPSGGTSGQYLKKSSNNNYDVEWATISVGSVSKLVNGSRELQLSSGGIVTGASTTYNVQLGSSTIPISGCYISGTLHLGTSTSNTLAFFGSTGSSKKTVGSSGTLASLISALQAYGLIA